jgi:hypothetical protein
MKKLNKNIRLTKSTIAQLTGGRLVASNTVHQISRKETCLCMTVTSPCEENTII